MKLDCSPIVYPAVAGSTKPILGQASALLKGYLFFNRGGLGAEPGSGAVHRASGGRRHPPPRVALRR